MSDLSYLEQRKLEQLFEMGEGYILNFSDRTFREFVADSTGRDIDVAKYHYASGSKANRLRGFWKEEPNHIVGKLTANLLQYCGSFPARDEDKELYPDCQRIARRLLSSAPVSDIEAISPNADGREFEVLAKSVREAIDNNEPESGLDRLHTFLVKYVRVVCQKRGIRTERDKPLHSLMGEYIKRLEAEGLIESEMAERILKSAISTMEAFNRVRNNQSLAHDNPVLTYSESLLIFNHVASVVRFIAAIEDDQSSTTTPEGEVTPSL